jgi:hypothetical protein
VPESTAGSDEIEFLDLGPPDRGAEPAHRSPHRRRPLVIVAVLVLAAAGLTAALVRHGSPSHPAAASTTTTSPSTAGGDGLPTGLAPEPTPVAATPSEALSPTVVTLVGHPLLGVTAGWELFARTQQAVVRVQLAAGTVSITEIPQLNSGSEVYFLLGPHSAIVRPTDFVPGYAVPDGGRPQLLSGALADGSILTPGPAPGTFWHSIGPFAGPSHLQLVDGAGRYLGQQLDIPVTLNQNVVSDGSGYVIVSGLGGSYDLRPGSLRRITTGQVVAVGPTSWIAEECDDSDTCTDVTVDSRTWQRQVIGPTTDVPSFTPGLVSADGARAILTTAAATTLQLTVLDVATGARQMITDLPDTRYDDEVIALSPDGQFLFVVGSSGALSVFDMSTMTVVPLGVRLPPVMQVAIRD